MLKLQLHPSNLQLLLRPLCVVQSQTMKQARGILPRNLKMCVSMKFKP